MNTEGRLKFTIPESGCIISHTVSFLSVRLYSLENVGYARVVFSTDV